MVVKPGYKQTDVGTIPEDWEVQSLGSVSSQITDGDHVTPKRVRQGYYLLSARNVRDGWIDLSDVDYVGLDEFRRMRRRCAPVPGDILISCSGHGLGRVSIVPAGLQCVLVRSAALVKANNKCANSIFIHHWLRSAHAQQQISVQLSRAAQPNLFINNIERLLAPIPPTKAEQNAIAGALSDADTLIEALERLVTKQRQIKHGAMQELLTGQRRLPGFTGEWEVKRIGEFTDCTAGGTPSTRIASYWGGSIRWMSSGELNLKRLYEVEGRITEAGLINSSAKVIPVRCILIGLAGQGKTRGTVAMNFVELCTNQSIAAVFPSPAFVPEYLYFNLDYRYDELREMSAGDGGRGGLNLTIIKAISVPLPMIAEQTVIAKVLSDMDAEITALETKLAKARQMMAGMMQELLTGKTRLVSSRGTHA